MKENTLTIKLVIAVENDEVVVKETPKPDSIIQDLSFIDILSNMYSLMGDDSAKELQESAKPKKKYMRDDETVIADCVSFPAKFCNYDPAPTNPLYFETTFGDMRKFIEKHGSYKTMCHLVAIKGIGGFTASAIINEALTEI